MTAAFLYWWDCLWIFEGPFNLAWEEIGKQQPLWVAFILPQHNMLLFLKALYNSCVNPLLWWNVSITQRPISHTHYNGVIHITPPFFLFFPSTYLIWMIFQEIRQRWPQWEEVNPELLLHWFILQQMASFVWARTCICMHIKQHPYKSCEERRTEKWKKRWPEIARDAHTAGVAARSGWFALPPAPSTPVALESIQLQPPPVKTELTFSSTRSCRIRTLKGLWSSSWHHSRWFLLLLL